MAIKAMNGWELNQKAIPQPTEQSSWLLFYRICLMRFRFHGAFKARNFHISIRELGRVES